MNLTELPSELVGHICQYLDTASLQNISLADKSCHSSAVPALFKAISIEPQHALHVRQLLHGKGYLKHVRTLEVKTGLPSTIRYDQETFPDPEFLYRFKADMQRSWDVRAQDSSWRPVADLLEMLPGVRDLIWTCPQQFPPCLLRSLHEHEPLSSCRLHLRTFSLRSFETHLEEIADPHELMLVQSPNLYSIWFNYCIADTWNNKHHLPEAVSRSVQGLAQNLRQVRLSEDMMGAEPDYSRYAHLIRPLESATSKLSHRKGRLESLQFVGAAQDLTVAKVEEWGKCTDFSVMKKLMFDCNVQPAVLNSLAGSHFSNLTALALELTIESSDSDYLRRPLDDSSRPGREFLCSLMPLKELKLAGEMIYDYFRDVIQHHGRALCTLHVEPRGFSPSRLSLPPEEVSWIASHCCILESLRLTMHRCKGNKSEVAAYLSISKIQTLQSLALTLDASDYLSMRGPGQKSEGYMARPGAHFDDFGRENADFEEYNASQDPRKGHILDMFINAALDERLARSIYSLLIDNRPPRALDLHAVELQSDGCGDFGTVFTPPAIAIVANEIQHRWLFQRTYALTSEHTAPKISEREHTNYLRTWDVNTDFGQGLGETTIEPRDRLDPRVESMFRHLWPSKADDSLWHEDWHSFDLYRSID
ncbi:hypothetical protein M409DRAFT_51134 [Zasmidium cellare ATCC 36951]|uniref:F-box domain-containing protein n=1 Tax=Zasmidium cellare ATCC 36951 TaxID=1080233 RepID=A0A6A6CXB4_ZASCE|nr:uncharacterized protein M409DRAFT_51134 [Zasmidium cellare ATCC 36951]KAF2170888.1 hypothetical protein M409DRAFT_51134 [Zasmidium cellare ATCC 36951]